MGQGVWMDTEKLGWDDEVREVLKHGTLSVGFIGLAETLVALIGEHHGESARAPSSWAWRSSATCASCCDKRSEETKLNYTLLATPAEGLSGRFVRIDREALRRDCGRDRSRVLHQQLPRAGVLSDSARLTRSAWKRPITR